MVVALCGLSITFDGYDLVVFGTTVPALLAEWQLSSSEAGTLASLALVGMLIGALLVGTLTDILGRRKMLLLCVTWFSASMALCAVAPSPEWFGAFRLLGGLGLGGLMPTAAALVIEYAPPGRRNFTYVVMQSGYAVGGILAAAVAIPVIPNLGWRVMYLIGAAPPPSRRPLRLPPAARIPGVPPGARTSRRGDRTGRPPRGSAARTSGGRAETAVVQRRTGTRHTGTPRRHAAALGGPVSAGC